MCCKWLLTGREGLSLLFCPWEEPSRSCCRERATSWSCHQEHLPPKRSLAQRHTLLHCGPVHTHRCQGCLAHWQPLSLTWCLGSQSWRDYDILSQVEISLFKKMKCQREESLAWHSVDCQFCLFFSKMSMFLEGENQQNFSSFLEQKMFFLKVCIISWTKSKHQVTTLCFC